MGAACVSALAWCSALSCYDIRQRRLPNWLTIPGAVVILTVAACAGRGTPAWCGAVALVGLYLVVHLVAPAAMGAGDVKLAAGVGGLTGAFGYDVWVLAAIGAPLLSAMWALVAVAVVRRPNSSVPHGVSMCTATLAALALVVFSP